MALNRQNLCTSDQWLGTPDPLHQWPVTLNLGMFAPVTSGLDLRTSVPVASGLTSGQQITSLD